MRPKRRRPTRAPATARTASRDLRSGLITTALPVLLALMATPSGAGVCTVPGTHTTVQAAIDDPACTEIQLSTQTYQESVLIDRSLTLTGPGGGGATIEGKVRIQGAGTLVLASGIRVENGCPREALSVASGAQLDGMDFEVLRSTALPCPQMLIFGDGFESGDTSAWSSVVG